MDGDDARALGAVRVEVLGAVRAHVNGQALEGARLGNLKTRQVVLALAIEAPLRVSTDQLVDRLWASPPDGAERIVNGLVSRARRALGRDAVEGNARSGYRLASDVDIDLRRSDELLARLSAAQTRGDAAELLRLAKDAVAALSAGTLAADDRSGFEWIEAARRHVEVDLLRARMAGARAALASSDPPLAIEFAEDVRTADPFDEEAVVVLMRAYAANGEPAQATRTFTQFQAELVGEGGSSPGADVVALADRIRSSIAAHSKTQNQGAGLRDDSDLEELAIRAAAVLGRSVDADDVAVLCSIDPVLAHALLGRVRSRGLIVEDGASYRFVDDQRRQEVLDTLPPPLRRSLHRRAADCTSLEPARAAEHLEAAGEWPSALEDWRRAAAEAKASFALSESEVLLGKAIAVADRCGDLVARVQCRVDRGRLREQLGRYPLALEDHRYAVDLARAGGLLDLEKLALERAAWTLYYARNTDGAEDLADRALPWCEQAQRSPKAPSTARVLLGRLRHSTGDIAGADAVLDSIDAEGLDAADRVATGLMAALLQAHHDRYADAVTSAEQTARVARQSGEYRDVLTSTFVAAVASCNAGWFATALDRIEVVSALSVEFDDPSYRVRALTMEAVVRLELGDLRHAAEIAARADDLARRTKGGKTHSGFHARLARAETSMRLGGRNDPVLRDPIPTGISYANRLELRRLELRARLEPELAGQLLERATADGAPKYQALAHQHLDRPNEALDIAHTVGSDLLLTKVGPEERRHEARARIAARLPVALRRTYTLNA